MSTQVCAAAAAGSMPVQRRTDAKREIGVQEITFAKGTLGLNIGADTLNCYRVLKKEAAGKDVDDLTDSDFDIDRKSTRLNSSHTDSSRMPSSA